MSQQFTKSLSIFVVYQGISIDYCDKFITFIYFYLYFCFLLQRTTIRMPQQKSMKFAAAKVANFGDIMAEMMGKKGDMEKEIKRLRHRVSVLSKRNHQLMKKDKSWAASSIASDASLSTEDEEVEAVIEGREKNPRIRVEETVVGEEVRGLAHGDRIPAPWCKNGVEEIWAECQERDRYQSRTKWKVAKLNVVDTGEAERLRMEAESVAEGEVEVAEAKVKLPEVEKVGEKRRRVGGKTEEEEEIGEVRELIAPIGRRAVCGGMLRRVGKESVFKDADPRLVAGGDSTCYGVTNSERQR